MVQFAVITEVPDDREGNYSCGTLFINPDVNKCIAGAGIIVDPPKFDEKLLTDAISNGHSGKDIIDLTKKQLLLCNTPVFRLGEIMVMGSNERTIPDGRKPSKWFVECEYFDNIEDAIKRAREVVE